MAVRVTEADLANERHAVALVGCLDAFVRDPAVAGRPLDATVKREVIERMREHPTVRAWLAWEDDRALGFAVGILTFSTFKARPALNVHDLGVSADARGRGIGRALLEAMAAAARDAGCCKLSLEVREDNTRARALYDSFGFGHFAPGEEQVPTFFLELPLVER